MNDFCLQKGIKREFSNARTPLQNGVAERRSRTLIEAAKTMLADAKLPVTFWAEAVNTACYVQNRVLVNKSHNKTPYELFNGRSPAIGFLKPFGCHVMILNTLDNLGKFEEKEDECYFIRYSMSSKAFRVFNKRTMRVKENLHVEFLENKAIKKGVGPNWLFDIDSLTKSMNYVPVDVGTIFTNLSGIKDATSQEVKKDVSSLRYIALPNWTHDALLEFSLSKPQDHCSTKVPKGSGNPNHTASMSYPPADQMETLTVETPIPTVSSPVLTAYFTDSQEPSSDARLISKRVANQEETPSLDNILSLTNQFEDILGVTINSDETNGVEVDISNMETSITASPTPTLTIYKDHPKRVRPIGTKWVLKNKKDERGIVFRNKTMLVAQGHTQEERIDYDGVFAHVARIKAIRLFLSYASFMGFTVYQMDVKSAFLFGTIDEEVHQVTPKECHLHAVKRIFRYLKDHPNLGLWYPKESPFDLVAYLDSDYDGGTQDRKSTTGGCQFLGRRLISWQCKKQIIVATSTTKAEYVAAASCYLLTKPFNAGRFQYLVCKRFPLPGKFSTVSVFLGFGLTFAGTFKYWGVLRILMISLRLIPLVSKGYVTMKACCKTCWSTQPLRHYEKSEHNIDFHPMVDFIEAFPLRIETTDEGTQILNTVDGIHRTVTESSLRRNLKLQDEEGISSLPDTELFENLTLMGYKISLNQKFTFQKVQFSHQWKYLIHTIMQCLSPKSTGFNEFSSNIATTLICLATNRTYNFSKMIFDGLVKKVNNKVSKFLMYPRFLTMCLRMSQFGQITHTHTYVVPFHTKKLFTTLRVNNPSFSGRIVPIFETMLVQQGEGPGTPTEPHHTPSPKAIPPSPTTHSLPTFPPVTTTSIPVVTPSETTPIRQYTRKDRIAQSSALPTVVDKPASPLRDVSQGEACPTDSGFIADQDRVTIAKSSTLPHDSAPRVTSPAADEGSIQQTISEVTALCTSLQRQHSELLAKFQAQEVEINRLKERVKLLEDRDRVAAQRSGVDAPIKGRSLDEGKATAERISDDSKEMATVLTSMDAAVLAGELLMFPLIVDLFPLLVPLLMKFPLAVMWFPLLIDAQVARELEEQLEREDQRRSEQIARDAEIVRIHAEEELQIMIDGLDRIKETIAKYLQEYHQFALELPMERRIELISDLEVTEEEKSSDEVPKEKVKEMMQLVPIEEVFFEALQVKHLIINWKVYHEGQRSYWKITSYKLQVKNYSQMANDLILKIYKIKNSPRQQGD
nr:ribonuclease H-like domain-containing protein [Tanacetum cinerariifolium]